MTETRKNLALEAAMERLAAGRSNRDLARISGVSHTAIGDMRWGLTPSYRLLTRFCDGLQVTNEQRADVFAAAGYPITPDESPRDRFWRRFGELHELCTSLGIEAPLPLMGGGSAALADADAADRAIADLLDGLRRDYPEHADKLTEPRR